MAGQFTKEKAQAAIDAVDEMFMALSKSKKMDFLEHLNDILMFLEAAKKAAPAEETDK